MLNNFVINNDINLLSNEAPTRICGGSESVFDFSLYWPKLNSLMDEFYYVEMTSSVSNINHHNGE